MNWAVDLRVVEGKMNELFSAGWRKETWKSFVTIINECWDMSTMEYSIVYAVIRPEIRERLSVGIIFCSEGNIEVKYSNVKLRVVKHLVPNEDYTYMYRTLKSLSSKKMLDSPLWICPQAA